MYPAKIILIHKKNKDLHSINFSKSNIFPLTLFPSEDTFLFPSKEHLVFAMQSGQIENEQALQ